MTFATAAKPAYIAPHFSRFIRLDHRVQGTYFLDLHLLRIYVYELDQLLFLGEIHEYDFDDYHCFMVYNDYNRTK